ncbi:MAG: 50S ribosomal protein L1 [bacterium]
MSNKVIKLKGKSKKYSANFAKIQEFTKSKKDKPSILEVSQFLFSLEQSNIKAGDTVELHFKLNIDPTKSDQLVRSSVVLPNGSGKKVVVAAFVNSDKQDIATKAGADIVGGEELVEKIKSENKINFDKAIAEPEMMKKLASIARILGVAGVMPNPKTGTVGDNIEEMVKSIKGGKVDFKNDKTSNLHIVCGKINSSFNPEKIAENIESVVLAVEKSKPDIIKKKYILSTYISTTYSPSIRLI